MNKEQDFSELLPAVQAALLKCKQERRLSALARQIGFSKNRLTEILYGKRRLTPYYIMKLIESGLISQGELFSTNIENLPKKKRILAKRILLDEQIVDLLDNEMQSLLKEALRQRRLDDLRIVLKAILKK